MRGDASALPAAGVRRRRETVEATQREVRRILDELGYREPLRARALARLDAIVMHPVPGRRCCWWLLFLVFQAVFSWAALPMDRIKAGVDALGERLQRAMADGPLRSLLVDGVIAGVGSVLVFLPQILILFFFILVLEDSGYLPRAAFLLDRLMGRVGLSGRAFIPLLSSFCLRHSRHHGHAHDSEHARPDHHHHARAADDLLGAAAGLCAADRRVHPGAARWASSTCRGWCCSRCMSPGMVGAVLVALVMKRCHAEVQLPPADDGTARIPLAQPAQPGASACGSAREIFLTRVGTIILALMVVLWFLASFPAPPPGATGAADRVQLRRHDRPRAAGDFRAHRLQLADLASRWCPGLAAREVAVGALGTVYALSAAADNVDAALTPMIAASWSLPTALSLLAWYVFAPQCLSTLATVKRETNSWRYPLIMAGYLFALA